MMSTSTMADIGAPSINTGASLMKGAKPGSLFFFLFVCVGGVGKLFEPQTGFFV